MLRQRPLTYTLTLTNQSLEAASDPRLGLRLSGDVRGTPVVENVQSCSLVETGLLSCTLGDTLDGGSSLQVNLTVVPKRPGIFAVEATVSASGEDPDPVDNVVTEETTVLR